MADQLAGQQSQASTTVDIGSVFGVDPTVAQAPVLLERGTPGAAGHLQRGGMFSHPRIVGGRKGTPNKVGTVLSSVAGFYKLDQGEQAQLVDEMEAAGYLGALGRGKRRKPQEVNSAWRSVVLDAARSGKTIPELLSDAISSASGDGSGTPGPTIGLTNTEDLRAVFREVFTKKLGVGPDDVTLDKMVAAYHQKELGAGLAAQGGGAVEGAPSPGTFADQFARQSQPVRYGARGAVKVASVVEQMLAGALPSTSQQMPGVS